ncbi:MAG: putative sugar nucleotidyl transferase [Saprospiraceae bacterium]
MQNIILFDNNTWQGLLPITYTKPIAKIRVGIMTIEEKWKRFIPANYSYYTKDYLSEKFPPNLSDDNIFINGTILPDIDITEKILNLNQNSILIYEDTIVAFRLPTPCKINFESIIFNNNYSKLNIIKTNNINTINNLWDIYQKTETELIKDFNLLSNGTNSCTLSATNTLIGDKNNLFISNRAKIEACILNTSTGPIFIDEDAEIMEGTVIRGPFYLGKHSTLKMSSKIYGATSIGHNCKVGGEVNNSVILDYSNKAHDGFLGNSVIGEWCNIGADTNNSNLKNNYAEVKLWNYVEKRFKNTHNQFCGLFMGDHSKTGINTMFNTGTVVGVSANIFGPGFPRNFIPSFSWGGATGFSTFNIDKSFETATTMMKRRGLILDEVEKKILLYIFNNSGEFRHWEK